jgi:uncharacterized RDD family membrane protein YckC
VTSAPPSWYPDPTDTTSLRYWDGVRWTEHRAPAPPMAPGFGTGPASAPAKATATPDGVPLAGLGYRLIARIVDGLILGAVQLLIALPLVPGLIRGLKDWVTQVDAEQQAGGVVDPFGVYTQTGLLRFFLILFLAGLAVSAAYTVTLVHLRGATLGKSLAGVRVRSWGSEGLPSWAQSWQRWLTCEAAGAIVGIYQLLDYLFPVWDPRKQAAHDKWPDTVVVASRPESAPH